MNAHELQALKARQKSTWESGDFGRVAQYNVPAAEDFMSRLSLKAGMRVLDVACGTGNLALIAARLGCRVTGIDIAPNLIEQARARARVEGLRADFDEGDAEALPFPDAQFDFVLSMFGAMFAPRPEVVSSELLRVTKPGGQVAMANWTPEGFIGKMFEVFKAHLPAPPSTVPSTMLWGDEEIVRKRLEGFSEVRCTRRLAVLAYPFPPAETVEFFKRYYGPTARAFDSLKNGSRESLQGALVELQSAHNTSTTPGTTETRAEYLEILAVR